MAQCPMSPVVFCGQLKGHCMGTEVWAGVSLQATVSQHHPIDSFHFHFCAHYSVLVPLTPQFGFRNLNVFIRVEEVLGREAEASLAESFQQLDFQTFYPQSK